MAATPEASVPLKPCGRCLEHLPQSAFSPKQWTNSSWRGTARRCLDCIGNGYRATHDGYHATKAGISLEPAEVAAAVAAASTREGGTVGAAFPAAWAAACEEVAASDLGRLCAVLCRNLTAAGASKAEKIAHRALAEECWLALGGRSPRAAPAKTAAARRAAAGGVGGVEGEWTGGAGLLATTEAARGRKALAASELVAAVAEHYPSLCLGADVASMPSLVFLPTSRESAGDVEAALAAIRAAAVSFTSVHRVWAIRETAITADETARAGSRLLSGALEAHPCKEGATFAIRCEGYPSRGAELGRTALLDAIASQCPATVDLAAPHVELHLRGFDVGGTRLCGLALSADLGAAASADLTRCSALSGRPVTFDDGDDRASEGRPYFLRDVNGGSSGGGGARPTKQVSGEAAAPDEAALDAVALPRLLACLDAALAAAGEVEAATKADAPIDVLTEAAAASPAEASAAEAAEAKAAAEVAAEEEAQAEAQAEAAAEAAAESHNARRRRRRARSGQAESLSQAITDGGVLATSTGEHEGTPPPPPPLWTIEFGAGTGSLSKRLAADARTLAAPLGGQVLIDRSCGRGGRKQATAAGEDRSVYGTGTGTTIS